MRLRIASRKSDLAKIQAHLVGEKIKEKFPKIQIEYQFRESQGDLNLHDPLWKMPGKSVFTEDFYQDLVDGKTDLVVHSWKDLAVLEKEHTFIAGTLDRADVRDVILVKKSHLKKIKSQGKLKYFTSSPRRMYHVPHFIKNYLPLGVTEVTEASVRGNVQTRIRKTLEDANTDAIVLAQAGLERLFAAKGSEYKETQNFLLRALNEFQFSILPVHLNPPAPAQGALALEIRRDDPETLSLIEKINNQIVFNEVQDERSILKSFGGGCHSQLGVFSSLKDQHNFRIISGFMNEKKIDEVSYAVIHGERIQNQFLESEIYSPLASSFFSTEMLEPSPSLPNEVNAIEIAKSNYIPQEWIQNNVLDSFILWTSGLETWKKLISQGIWVHGSQESLGDFFSQPQKIFGKKLSWKKLSHKDAEKLEGYLPKENIKTCALHSKNEFSDLSAYEIFFWRSGSLFLKAVKEQPQIISKIHCCGFGMTSRILKNFLIKYEIKQNLFIFPSEEIWRHYVTKI